MIVASNFYDFGPTGGPSGVASVLRRNLNGLETTLKYAFLFRSGWERAALESIRNRVPNRFLRILPNRTVIFLQNIRTFARLLYLLVESGGRKRLFAFAHDVQSAIRFSILKIPYALVFHAQGAIESELESAGISVSKTRLWVLTRIQERAFQESALVCFPSAGGRSAFLATCSLSSSLVSEITQNSVILHNGLDLPFGTDAEPDEHAEFLAGMQHFPSQYESIVQHLAAGRSALISVCSWTTHKGVDLIPDALASIPNFTEKYFWIAIGNGHLRSQVWGRIHERKIAENVIHFDSHIEHEIVQELMGLSRYYLMLHRVSIFDFATLEAMANGLIPVLSRVGGNVEVDKEGNVVFVDSGIALPEHPAEIQRLSILNKRVHSEYFSGKAMAASYDRIAKAFFEKSTASCKS